MNHPAPPAPAGAGRQERRRLPDRIRCLAVRIGKIVRAAHSGSVPF